jgi:hypothetical protein
MESNIEAPELKTEKVAEEAPVEEPAKLQLDVEKLVHTSDKTDDDIQPEKPASPKASKKKSEKSSKESVKKTVKSKIVKVAPKKHLASTPSRNDSDSESDTDSEGEQQRVAIPKSSKWPKIPRFILSADFDQKDKFKVFAW